MLRIENLNKSFGGVHAIENLSIDLKLILKGNCKFVEEDVAVIFEILFEIFNLNILFSRKIVSFWTVLTVGKLGNSYLNSTSISVL